jgi:hypothetical protein
MERVPEKEAVISMDPVSLARYIKYDIDAKLEPFLVNKMD